MAKTYVGQILKQVREELKLSIPSPKYELLILPLKIGDITDNAVTLLATGEKHIEWLREEFWERLVHAFSQALGKPAELRVVVDPEAADQRAE